MFSIHLRPVGLFPPFPVPLLFFLGCSNLEIKDEQTIEDSADTFTCTPESTPAQLRLLTRNEYNSSIYSLFYGEGDTCVSSEECSLSEACQYGVCRPKPCDLHTFIWPYDAQEVWIAGTFNDWTPQPMSKRDGIWVQTLELEPGEWRYKFIVDGEWIHDPSGDDIIDDGFGGFNNFFILSCSDTESVLANPSRGFPLESVPQHYGFQNHSSNLVSSTHLLRYIEVAETLSPVIISQSDFDLETFASTAFRRPLLSEERERYRALDEELAVQLVLTSANFLYRDETVSLSQFRLASALSYFLWGSPPDTHIRSLAATGHLDNEEGLSETIELMLSDPRAQVQMKDFAIQWLGVEGVLTIDKGHHESFDAMRQSIYKEAGNFVSDVFFEQGKVDELLTQPIDPVDDIYERVDAGILGLPAVLSAYAHSDQTSPVMRGLFVREKLLCQSLGAPPADAGGVPDVDPNASTRERFAQHADDPGCAGCHQFIDPIGFGFEHYNEIGVWRESDGGHPIDASGHILGVDRLGDDSGGSFQSLPELAQYIAESKQFQRCVSDHMMRFAIGREEGQCTAYQAATNDVQALIKNLIMSESFLRREP